MSCFFLSTDRNRGVFFSVAIPEATYEKSYDGLCTFVGFYSRLDPSARGASSATRGLTRLFVPLILTGHTLQDLQAWGISLVAQTGLQFDLRSAQGKLIASLMAALAEFERDLLRERVRSGIAAARKRGVVFGRRPGQRVKADRFAPKVLKLVAEGQSYREISHRLGLSKNTVLDIVKRNRAP